METRKLGYWETIQKVFYDNYRCSGLILQVARITGHLEPDLLRRALSLLQQRHPMLRARFREDAAACYFDIDDFSGLTGRERLERVPLEVVPRTGEAQWLPLSETESLRSFDSPHGYPWRIVQVCGPQESELIFIVHHSICDGLSTTRLANDLLDLCGRIADGRDLPDLAPLPFLPCSDALLARIPPPETAPADLAAISEEAVTHWRFDCPAPLSQRSTRTIYRQIEHDDTARFMARCKKEGVSSTAAFTAIILQATAPSQHADLNLSISSGTSLRRYCAPEVDPGQFGCFITMTQAAFALQQGQSVWDLARQSQKRLAAAVTAQQRQGFLPRAFHKAFVSSTMKRNLAGAEKVGIFSGGICYSNLGALAYPRQFGPFELAGLHALTCEVAGFYYLYVNTRSLHGRLYWDFAYTEPLVSRQQADAATDAMVQAVLREAAG